MNDSIVIVLFILLGFVLGAFVCALPLVNEANEVNEQYCRATYSSTQDYVQCKSRKLVENVKILTKERECSQ